MVIEYGDDSVINGVNGGACNSVVWYSGDDGKPWSYSLKVDPRWGMVMVYWYWLQGNQQL